MHLYWALMVIDVCQCLEEMRVLDSDDLSPTLLQELWTMNTVWEVKPHVDIITTTGKTREEKKIRMIDNCSTTLYRIFDSVNYCELTFDVRFITVQADWFCTTAFQCGRSV